MYPPQPTFLRERRVFEVVAVNRKIRCDMVADHLKPVALLVGKLQAPTLLLP